MNKRFLSAVLALVLCFAVCVTSFADVTLMATITAGDVKNQASDWIINQFDVMTEDQLAVLDAAYATYLEPDTQAQIEELADRLVSSLFNENEEFFKNETLKDLYKWKLMRDIKDGLAEVEVSGDEYAAWLADFTAYEDDNDETVSLRSVNASLDGLGAYSEDLTEYFEQFAIIANEAEITGEDAEKARVYAEKALNESLGTAFDSDAEFNAYLKADVKEVTKNVILNVFDITVKVGTGKVRPKNEEYILDMLETKNLKGFFLLFGEDFVRKVVNAQEEVIEELKAIDKSGLISDLLSANGFDLVSASNEAAVDAMYSVARQVAQYLYNSGVAAELVAEFEGTYGITYAKHFEDTISALYEALGYIEPNHGIELIHFNTYLGRAFLRPVTGSGVEVQKGEVSALILTLSHSKEYLANALSKTSLAEFDMSFEEGSVFAVEAGEGIGEFYIDATAAAEGDEATVYVYRGIAEAAGAPDEEDVYRYVASYTVSAVGEEATEPSSEATEPSSEATEPSSDTTEPPVTNPYVTLEDVADTTADGTITIKGTTNLPYVTVLVTKIGDEKPIYAVVYSRDEFEGGITLKAPQDAEAGNEYTVIVGTEKAVATDTFKILGEVSEYTVTLENVADTKADGTITIKGTTNLPYVTVVITKIGDEKPIYAVVYSKAEFEGGITLKAPAGAEVDDEYTVIVGTEKAVATDTFKILEEEEPSSDVTEPSSEATEPSSESATLAVAGADSRSVTRNKTIVITTTPQGAPEGSYVVWTVADATIAEIQSTTGDYGNIGTIKGIKKGTTTVTATLYDAEGNVLDSKTITIKVVTSGGGGGGNYNPPVEPTEPDTSDQGTTGRHECEWPDIAATATSSAHWAHETIDIMTINGYVNGYPDGLFRPDQYVTRAEFSAFVYRILGLRLAEEGVGYDDTVGHWAEGIIGTMSLPEGYGMLRGYGDGNFGPDDYITREQAIAIIARAKSAVWVEAEDGVRNSFSDAEDISWWFNGEVDAAVTNGLVTGYEDGSFKPLSYTTRAEACVLLARAWPEVLETASTAEE